MSKNLTTEEMKKIAANSKNKIAVMQTNMVNG